MSSKPGSGGSSRRSSVGSVSSGAPSTVAASGIESQDSRGGVVLTSDRLAELEDHQKSAEADLKKAQPQISLLGFNRAYGAIATVVNKDYHVIDKYRAHYKKHQDSVARLENFQDASKKFEECFLEPRKKLSEFSGTSYGVLKKASLDDLRAFRDADRPMVGKRTMRLNSEEVQSYITLRKKGYSQELETLHQKPEYKVLSRADDLELERWATEKKTKRLNTVLSKEEVQTYIEAREYEVYQGVKAKGDQATVKDMRNALRQLGPKADAKYQDTKSALAKCNNEQENLSQVQRSESNNRKALDDVKVKVREHTFSGRQINNDMPMIEEFVEGRCNESTQKALEGCYKAMVAVAEVKESISKEKDRLQRKAAREAALGSQTKKDGVGGGAAKGASGVDSWDVVDTSEVQAEEAKAQAQAEALVEYDKIKEKSVFSKWGGWKFADLEKEVLEDQKNPQPKEPRNISAKRRVYNAYLAKLENASVELSKDQKSIRDDFTRDLKPDEKEVDIHRNTARRNVNMEQRLGSFVASSLPGMSGGGALKPDSSPAKAGGKAVERSAAGRNGSAH